MLVQKTHDGAFLISAEELAILRAGLFVTIYHLDPGFDEDVQTVSAFELSVFKSLLGEVEELAAS